MLRIHPGYIILLLIGLIMAGACAPYYIPGNMPTPPMDSTSDIYLAAGVGAGGWQGEAVVAPMDHLWMAGHLSYIPFTDSTEVPSPDKASYMESSLGQLHGEFGLGWYSIVDGGQYGILAGYGRGHSSLSRFSNSFPDTTLDWEFAGGNFETYFLQLSAAPFRLDSGGYAGVLLRGEYVRFREFLLDGVPQPLPTALLIEPRLFIVGATHNPTLFNSGFEFQVGFQFRVGGREEFVFQPLHISLMIRGLLDLM
jgi:hypothetical protein